MADEARRVAVGVDVGNTKTVAVACDLEGRVRGIGRGGPGNWESLGEEAAARVMTEVAEQAARMAGLGRDAIISLHVGAAGIDWPDDVPRMRRALHSAGWACPLTIENDSFLTVRAGSPEGHGIGVTAGTGICAAIVLPDGEKYFYGGFTDLGGGYSTSTYAFQAVVRAADGRGPETALTKALLDETGHSSTWDLVYSVHRGGKQVPAPLLNRVLFATAAEGDPVAVEIVSRFGVELGLCATNLIRRYHLTRSDPAVVAAGSRFTRTGPLLFEVFRLEVLKAAPRARVIRSDHPPVMGAVRGALAASGRDSAQVWETAKRTALETGWFREDMGEQGEESGA